MYTTSFEKTLWRIIWLVIIAVIVYGFVSTTKAFGMGGSDVSICDTVDGNTNAAYDGHSVDSMDAQTRHCIDTSAGNSQPVKSHDDKPVTTVTTVPVTKHTSNPVTTVTSDKPAKAHCNNGNGNGAEGCNASDKGNQDETTVKGDKAENHPNK